MIARDERIRSKLERCGPRWVLPGSPCPVRYGDSLTAVTCTSCTPPPCWFLAPLNGGRDRATGHRRAWSRILTSCRAQYLLTRDVMPQTTCAHISPPGLANSTTARRQCKSLTATPNMGSGYCVACAPLASTLSRAIMSRGRPRIFLLSFLPQTAVANDMYDILSVPSSNPNFGRLPQSRRPPAAGRSSKDSNPAARGALAGLHPRGPWSLGEMEAAQLPASRKEALGRRW